MGLNNSKVGPETLRRQALKSLPPFVGDSFWHKPLYLNSISNTLTNMSENGINGNIEDAKHKNDVDKKKEDRSNTDFSEQSRTTTIAPDSNFCHSHKRRLVIPPAEVQFRSNRCCVKHFLRQSPKAVALDSDENQDESVITIRDSLGTLRIPQFRRWQIFPGNNRFYCDGRIMTGPDRMTFYGSFALLNLVFAMFAVFVIPFQSEASFRNALIPCTLVLHLLSVCTMLYSANIDPGIVPRATRPEVDFSMKKFKSTVHANGVQPFVRENINGVETVKRWCPTCLFYKPPRATHCRICNNCIERFDHHCPFLGNCVGQRNYPSFVIFLLSVVLSGTFITSFAVVQIVFKCKESKNLAATFNNWHIIGTLITGTIAFVSCIPVFVLLYFHIQCMLRDVTTNEDLKSTWKNRSPFDRGSKWKNILHILCDPRIPSLIGRREIVTREWIESLEQNDTLMSTLLKKFGRKPNDDTNFDSEPQNKVENSKINEDLKKLDQINMKFLSLHRKSAPDINREYEPMDTKWDRSSLQQFSTRLDGFMKKEEDELKKFTPPPLWFSINLSEIRKTNVTYDDNFDIGDRNAANAWNCHERVGPSYQRSVV